MGSSGIPGVWIVNIYAPLGAEKRQERKDFLKFDLTYLLQATPNTVILGGDFNYVLAKEDVTGHFNFSRALNTLVKGYNLVDMWTTAPDRGVYTHYTRQGGSEAGQNICDTKHQRKEMWDRNESDCVYGPLGSGPAYSPERDHCILRPQLL
jgi:hypothetical protein